MRLRLGIGGLALLALTACTQVTPAGSSVSSSSPNRSVPASAAASTGRAARPPAAASTSTGRASSSRPAPQGSSDGPVIVLNPGHNGADAANPAAISREVPAGFGEMKPCDTTGTETNLTGYPEHAFNFDVALRVRAALKSHGVRVILTRASDSAIGPCVDARARIGNRVGVAAVISIHADGAPVDGHGFHVCQDSRQPAGPTVAAASNALTVAEHDSLLAGSGLTTSTYLGTDGYYPRDDLAALNLATVPATFLELGNMRNDGDAALQSSPAGRQRIANAVAQGVLSWLASR
jgi:N-acetylmuramoyl-L-alanine amidase